MNPVSASSPRVRLPRNARIETGFEAILQGVGGIT